MITISVRNAECGSVPAHSATIVDEPQLTARLNDHEATRRATWLGRISVFGLVLLVRLPFTIQPRIFRIIFDEPAQLAVARYLSGRGRWTMLHAPTYQPGMGMLLAPVHVLVADPMVVYRAAMLLNCVLAAASAVVLVSIIDRLGVLSRRGSLVVATLVACAPAVVPLSGASWSDPAVTLLFLATVRCVLQVADAPSTRWSVAAVTSAGIGYLFHGRMLPLLGSVTAGLVVHAVIRRRWNEATVVGTVGLVAGAAVHLWSAWIIGRLWWFPSTTNSPGSIVERLQDPAGVASSGLGQVWYQAVSWLGLGLLGALVAAMSTLGRRAQWSASLRAGHATTLLGLTLPMIATSIVFMANAGDRRDYLMYGRYNDDVIWPLVAVGGATLWAARGRYIHIAAVTAGLAAAIVALTMGFWAVSGDQLRGDTALDMVNGLSAFTGLQFVDPLRIAALSIGALAVLALGTMLRNRTAAVVAGIAAVLCAVGGAQNLAIRWNVDSDASSARRIESVQSIVPAGELGYRISYTGYFKDATQVALLAQLYQYWLPNHVFVAVDDHAPVPEYTLSVAGDPALVDVAEIVWTHPEVPHVLWHRVVSPPAQERPEQ